LWEVVIGQHGIVDGVVVGVIGIGREAHEAAIVLVHPTPLEVAEEV